MYAKAHLAVENLKARGFEVISSFTEDDVIYLLRDGWGVAVPKSEKVWKARGENPLACWHWSEEEASA